MVEARKGARETRQACKGAARCGRPRNLGSAGLCKGAARGDLAFSCRDMQGCGAADARERHRGSDLQGCGARVPSGEGASCGALSLTACDLGSELRAPAPTRGRMLLLLRLEVCMLFHVCKRTDCQFHNALGNHTHVTHVGRHKIPRLFLQGCGATVMSVHAGEARARFWCTAGPSELRQATIW